MLMERAAALAPRRMLISLRVNYSGNILMLSRRPYSMKHMTKKKKMELTSALGSIYIVKVGSRASHGDLLAVVAQALCTFDLNRAAAFNLSLFICLNESFKSSHFASAVNDGDVFIEA